MTTTEAIILTIVFIIGAVAGPLLWALMIHCLEWVELQWFRFGYCWGWYTLRKAQGHPISLWRAFFGARPRFGLYEYEEEGCPDWDRKAYELVRSTSKYSFYGRMGRVEWSNAEEGFFIPDDEPNRNISIASWEVQEIK